MGSHKLSPRFSATSHENGSSRSLVRRGGGSWDRTNPLLRAVILSERSESKDLWLFFVSFIRHENGIAQTLAALLCDLPRKWVLPVPRRPRRRHLGSHKPTPPRCHPERVAAAMSRRTCGCFSSPSSATDNGCPRAAAEGPGIAQTLTKLSAPTANGFFLWKTLPIPELFVTIRPF
jgi:hypothetical protein